MDWLGRNLSHQAVTITDRTPPNSGATKQELMVFSLPNWCVLRLYLSSRHCDFDQMGGIIPP